jgi:dGTPase
LEPSNPELLDFTEFDGNAQGFRVLTKNQFLNDLYSLNLTYASLASFLKYPNIGKSNKGKDINIALHKHGVFTTEYSQMKKVMEGCGINRIGNEAYCRHPFSYIMEACDTICYLVMDLEDAANKGKINFDILEHVAIDGDKNIKDEKNHIIINKDLQTVISACKSHFDEEDPQRKKIVQLRVDLIHYLIKYAIKRFVDNLDDIINGNFKEELLFDKKNENCLADYLLKLSMIYIYRQREIESLELTGDAVISGIIDHYIRFLFNGEKGFRQRGKDLISHASFYTILQEHLDKENKKEKAWVVYDKFDPKDFSFGERLRLIRDFVSGMTDKFALSHYQKLNGQKI